MSRILPAEGHGSVPIHVWGREVPDGAVEQLRRIASQPYVVEHVAAMPDLHMAHGIAVGTVFATEGVIVPSALGGDLGCGMSAVRFAFPAWSLSRKDLEAMLRQLAALIPVGDGVHRGKGMHVPPDLVRVDLSTHSLDRARERLLPKHLRTLGGGNHFVEMDRDGAGNLWVLVHSGSRGLGSVVAEHHLRVAEDVGLGDIRGLRVDSSEGQACLKDTEWALAFARANRDAILEAAIEVVEEATRTSADAATRLDVHHNFFRREEHFGKNLWVHRKGAISATLGDRALIPGSMGTASYIVEGLSEPMSFRSGSHGAGRVMTRREARERIKPVQLHHAMRRVVYDERRSRSLVEESPQAYRSIADVLEDESDLVTPVVRLEPIAVLKG
jgi:tRNA-splicing ligase RtcB (3'-phosphate/5'-hydroxy nucleic acid ligase)